ncbi:hypothetical protein RGQ29_021558 [Quercus rubra]|uniref:Uncharacterized protein n=1 Tax=Quercus rubra TaxID=3512 RepID=A0AAN7FD93_QUERU|nr:hypothetical protein RGQ29_021558 [Quercus rubra]
MVDFTPEEVGKLQQELTKLLRKPNVEKQIADLPLDRFLNCPSSLKVDRRISNALCTDSDQRDEDIDRTISVILDKCKDICADNNKKVIGKKSISFLLKKMFVCSSGFAPAPSLRDTLQESRMEKLLRVMLHKKMNHQNNARPSSAKRYLEDKQKPKKEKDDEPRNKTNDGCKWVKTDSEFLQDYTFLSLTHWDSSSSSLAEWPLLLFLHLFLHFFLPHSSHQVAINASQLVLTFVHKDDFNSSHWKASPASSICFADFLAILQQARCGLDPRGAMHTQQS